MPLGTDRLLRPGGGGGVVLRGVIFLNELFWRGGGKFFTLYENTKSEGGKILRHTKGTN